MSSYISFSGGATTVKVNAFATPRPLSFTGAGVSVTEDSINNNFTINIPGGGGGGFSEADFIIYKSGSTYYAKNVSTGNVDFSNSTPDIGALTNSVIGSLPNGGTIKYGNGGFTAQTNINIPTGAPGVVKPYSFVGSLLADQRQMGTWINFGSSFPSGTYLFQAVSAGGSSNTSVPRIEKFVVDNVAYARSGTPGQNINLGSTIIDAGLIKFESDGHGGNGNPFILRDVFTQYLWRGIHLVGYMFYPIINNFSAYDNNPNFVGDFDIRFEFGTGHPDRVKLADVRNVRSNHNAGSGVGTGSMNVAMDFSGGYHYIADAVVDGGKYNTNVVGFKQLFSSNVYRIFTEDLVSTAGGVGNGVFVFDTTDPGGVLGDTTHSTYNDQFFDLFGGSGTNNTFNFLNSPFRNYIRAYAYWGGNIVINDAGAAAGNTMEIIDGQQPLATANTVISSSNGNVKLVDKRVGANTKGFSTQNGVQNQTAYTITHNCFATPVNFYVYPVSKDASGAFDVTVNSTNLTITYQTAPPAGTANLKYSWYADCYPS